MGRSASVTARRRREVAELVSDVWYAKPKPDTELIAIDPGDDHVGVAFFATDEGGKWYCQDAQQIDDPDGFEEAFAEMMLSREAPPIVVYEIFRLYGDKAQLQKGSQFRTSQMIGVIKFVCRMRNDHADRHDEAERLGKMMSCELQGGQCADPDARPQRIEVVGQVADIKKPTAGILRHKKIKSVGKQAKKENPGWGDHCIDAELHGWKYILDTMKGEASEPSI
jgi:hypothetical protein